MTKLDIRKIRKQAREEATNCVIQAWEPNLKQWVTYERIDPFLATPDRVRLIARHYLNTKFRCISASGRVIVEPIEYGYVDQRD